ncbi:hypothetical protein HZH68_002490 [Vespula germanica]|uniref:Uncharacterized protein n=1 Tax=Vespula germanica TaxID=30212 RepID=A0A834NMG5_VESGE|nr:hypothetical protein HZH68_002490 [Vespula germanica]
MVGSFVFAVGWCCSLGWSMPDTNNETRAFVETPRDAFYDDSRGMPAIPTRYPVRIKRVDLRSVQSYLNGGSS